MRVSLVFSSGRSLVHGAASCLSLVSELLQT